MAPNDAFERAYNTAILLLIYIHPAGCVWWNLCGSPALLFAPLLLADVHAVSAIAGIVNRDGPRLWVNYTHADPTWLAYVHSNASFFFANTTDGGVLPDLPAVVRAFSTLLRGAVLYDPAVPATSNVASTAAGVLDVVPVCYRAEGDVYKQLVASQLLDVKLDLVGKFNDSAPLHSAKNAAYHWALDTFLSGGASGGAADPRYLAYYVDYFWTNPSVARKGGDYTSNTVSNHDYFISKRAFFFDLSYWADEAPNDDPNQPLGTDFATVKRMLSTVAGALHGSAMTWMGGFTPWAFKYVDAKHGGVPTEWQTAAVNSQYNVFLDADACCVDGVANMAFYQTFPLQDRYVQNARPTRQSLAARGYLDADGSVVDGVYAAWYVGDYDSAAWVARDLYGNFVDPARGSVPLGWAVNPNLAARFPPAFHLLMSSLSPTDVLTTGDSGAGYVNPTALLTRPLSGLPSAAALWRQHCTAWYQKFDVRTTGVARCGCGGGAR